MASRQQFRPVRSRADPFLAAVFFFFPFWNILYYHYYERSAPLSIWKAWKWGRKSNEWGISPNGTEARVLVPFICTGVKLSVLVTQFSGFLQHQQLEKWNIFFFLKGRFHSLGKHNKRRKNVVQISIARLDWSMGTECNRAPRNSYLLLQQS